MFIYFLLVSSLFEARSKLSSFGDDDQLADELPPNWSLRRFQEDAKSIIKECADAFAECVLFILIYNSY